MLVNYKSAVWKVLRDEEATATANGEIASRSDHQSDVLIVNLNSTELLKAFL